MGLERGVWAAALLREWVVGLASPWLPAARVDRSRDTGSACRPFATTSGVSTIRRRVGSSPACRLFTRVSAACRRVGCSLVCRLLVGVSAVRRPEWSTRAAAWLRQWSTRRGMVDTRTRSANGRHASVSRPYVNGRHAHRAVTAMPPNVPAGIVPARTVRPNGASRNRASARPNRVSRTTCSPDLMREAGCSPGAGAGRQRLADQGRSVGPS
jgi:hypothetical protein